MLLPRQRCCGSSRPARHAGMPTCQALGVRQGIPSIISYSCPAPSSPPLPFFSQTASSRKSREKAASALHAWVERRRSAEGRDEGNARWQR